MTTRCLSGEGKGEGRAVEMFGKSAEEAPRLESRGYGRAGDQQSRSGGRGGRELYTPERGEAVGRPTLSVPDGEDDADGVELSAILRAKGPTSVSGESSPKRGATA